MAYLRRRSGGRFSLLIYWKGKKHQEGLCTTDPAEAARIKTDVEEQLRRIRSGEAPKATQLLDEGFSIVDVLFGCPEIDKRLAFDPEELAHVAESRRRLSRIPATNRWS